MFTGVPGGRARSALAAGPGRRFSDVRWVPETGSTNADVMELARQGAPEGIVLVADHQTAGRGRAGRTWEAPPDAGLLCSVLLRPPAKAAEACTMAMGLAAAEAVEAVAGFVPRLKWPNDLVWPGDGTSPDRKLAGILAEADWPPGSNPDSGYRAGDQRVPVVVGIGINVGWPEGVPAVLADIAVACNQVAGRAPDREDLLVALLVGLAGRYQALVDDVRADLVAEWRRRSATLGRRVRLDLGRHDVEGVAAGITPDGRLVVDTVEGERRTFAVGDVTHLR
jgi:BirA family biotin operon repressor/biotin-[acetyl-CoA-carboxylase] ligase